MIEYKLLELDTKLAGDILISVSLCIFRRIANFSLRNGVLKVFHAFGFSSTHPPLFPLLCSQKYEQQNKAGKKTDAMKLPSINSNQTQQ